MTKTLFSIAAIVTLSLSAPAFAGAKLMSACRKDLKKHHCKAKTDEEAHLCLEKNEKHDAKEDGFTHACYEANEAFEKAEQGGEQKQ